MSSLRSIVTRSIFPLNLKGLIDKRTVLEVVMEDIAASEHYLVVTGFTSLAHIIELFGGKVSFGCERRIAKSAARLFR